MSNRSDMYKKAKELTPEQRKDWKNAMTPLTGIVVNFRGVHCVDTDVYNLLVSFEGK